MKKLSKIFTVLVTLMVILSYATSVCAFSASATLTSSSKLKAGETITINVNLGSLDVGNGVDALVATVEYDTNVLEAITQDNIVGKDGWVINAYSTSTNKFTATRSSKYTTGGNIITMTFKVKSNITVDSTKITLKNIEISGGAVADGGTGDIAVNTASITINAEKDNTSTTEPITPTTTTNTTTKNNTTIKDNTVTKLTTLPKTGVGQFGIIALIVVSIVGVCSYVLYKKTSKIVK